MKRPTVVAIGGFESDVGKTTLMCDLLGVLSGWEAIKTTRGHYRSCGKDPLTCCVSHLLSDQPTIRSGREETNTPGKDTGRYWEAGASNVHWLIATEKQMESGIKSALKRVKAPGVLIEGNSFTKFVEVDFAILVTRSKGGKIKSSARRLLAIASGLFVSDLANTGDPTSKDSTSWCEESIASRLIRDLPIYTQNDLPELTHRLRQIQAQVAS